MALRAAASLSRRISSTAPYRTPVRRMAAAAATGAPPGAPAPPPPPYHVLRYEYVADILERRGPHRDAHLAAAKAMLDSGRLVCAGATGAPAPDGALFIFKNIGPDEIEAFVQADPYVKAGLVTSHKVSPYGVVVGAP